MLNWSEKTLCSPLTHSSTNANAFGKRMQSKFWLKKSVSGVLSNQFGILGLDQVDFFFFFTF